MAEDNVLVIENPELLEALKVAPQQVLRHLTNAMQDVLLIIQGDLGYASYPPSSEANMPGRFDSNGDPMGYYERGRGWWYPVKRPETLAGMNSVSMGVQDIKSAYKRHKINLKNIAYNEKVVIRPGGVSKQMPSGVTTQMLNYVTERSPVVAGYKLAKGKGGSPGTSELLGKSWTTQLTSGEDFVAGEVGTPVSYADFVQGYNLPSYHLDRGWIPMDERLEGLMPKIDTRFDQALEDYIANFGESNERI